MTPPISFSRFTAALAVAAAVAWAAPAARAFETEAEHAILIDAATGDVLYDKAADALMAPASMTKMMTAYMIFERLKAGELSLDDTFTVSVDAWKRGGAASGSSTMFLDPNSQVRLEDLIRGIVVQSGNDACIVIAEGLAGSESAFAERMTEKARELGMTNTVFRNATGWPDDEHLTTARDLATLAKRMIEDFPTYYRYYSETSFTYNGIAQSNRNPLLYRNIGADGIKTGHTSVSGYGLTASAKRDDQRLILVVNGLDSRKARASESLKMMEWGFREFGTYALFQPGEAVTEADVWLGVTPRVPLVIETPVVLSMRKEARRDMQVKAVFEAPITAPVAVGDTVGEVIVTAPGEETRRYPLRAGAASERLGLFGRLKAAVDYILWGASG
jgi:D-alanyl-D-alanine carboxypeptidase (penicillin-binding protein 5/6)